MEEDIHWTMDNGIFSWNYFLKEAVALNNLKIVTFVHTSMQQKFQVKLGVHPTEKHQIDEMVFRQELEGMISIVPREMSEHFKSNQLNHTRTFRRFCWEYHIIPIWAANVFFRNGFNPLLMELQGQKILWKSPRLVLWEIASKQMIKHMSNLPREVN